VTNPIKVTSVLGKILLKVTGRWDVIRGSVELPRSLCYLHFSRGLVILESSNW